MVNSKCKIGVLVDRYIIRIFIASLAFAAQGALAFQPHPALQTLIRDTLNSHPLVSAQRAAIEAAEFGSEAARRQFLPTPSISVEQTLYENDVPGNSTDSLSGVVRIDIPVYTGGRLTGQLDQAKSRENLAQAELALSRQELSVRVVEAWGQWVGAKLKVQAQEESVEQHQRLLALVQRRSEQGYSASVDVDFARLRLQSVQSELQAANTQLRTSLAQLRIVSGKNGNEEVSLPVYLGEIGNPLSWAQQNEGALIDKAFQSNPEIMRVNALYEESKAGVDIANSRDWPEVVLSAEKRYGGVELADRVRDNRSRAFLGISTQFGAGISHRSEQRRTVALLESTRQLGNAEKRLLSETVRVDIETLAGAQQRIENLLQALASSELVLASWERQFLEGRKQWQDLMNAAREKLQLQTQLADSQAAVQLSGWRLYLSCEGVDAVLALAQVSGNE